MPESQIQVKLNPDVQPTGSDLAVCNAARRSFNNRSEWDIKVHHSGDYAEDVLKEKDKRLIQFLARGMTAGNFEDFLSELIDAHSWLDDFAINPINLNDLPSIQELLWKWRNTPTHDTPFNHCFVSFEVKAPIFVARQLVKHEYLIMSEFSRRYITDDIEFYEPDYWRKAAPNKKQGSLEEPMEPLWPGSDQPWLYYNGKKYEEVSKQVFLDLIENGCAPEQARMVLPQSTMTEWTWSGTLGAFAKMCQLRLHPEAQYEARLVAKQVYQYLLDYYPVSAKALVEGADV